MPLDHVEVFSDTDVASSLHGEDFRIVVVGQEQPQALAFVANGRAMIQHVEDDHVPGIVFETLYRQHIMPDDHSIVSHRHFRPWPLTVRMPSSVVAVMCRRSATAMSFFIASVTVLPQTTST